MQSFEVQPAVYRYITTDLMTGTVLADLPFIGVSYERALKSAGSFSGNIPVLDETAAYSAYDTTMPGRTALYVLRNDVCVWGGIIWSRSYAASAKMLTINASEFTSYLHHRLIWKTFGHEFAATGTASGGGLYVDLDVGQYDDTTGTQSNLFDEFVEGYSVRIDFYEIGDLKYSGYYSVEAVYAPTNEFSVLVPGLPDGDYPNLTVTVRVDTYDYVRRLLSALAIDFSSPFTFPNVDIEPSKLTKYEIINIGTTDDDEFYTIVLSEPHDLLVGQRVRVSGESFETYDVAVDAYDVQEVVNDTTVKLYGPSSGVLSPVPDDTNVNGLTSPVYGKTLTNSLAILRLSSNAQYIDDEDVLNVADVDDPGDAIFDGKHVVYRYQPQVTITATAASAPSSAIFTTDGDHPFEVDDWVEVFEVEPAVYNGLVYITAVDRSDPYTFTGFIYGTPTTVTKGTGYAIPLYMVSYTVEGFPADVPYTAISSPYGSANRHQSLIAGSYGSFGSVAMYGQYPNYSDIGLTFSPAVAYSGVSTRNKTSRGYELRSVGQELDEYADIEDGFEYRVDCDYVESFEIGDNYPGYFTKTFVMLPINYPDPPAPGEVSPLSRFGADRFIFEYPGNISEVTLDESAENAATRFFVVGNIPDLGEDASQPYAAATAKDLLESGWPLLDAEDTKQDVYDEDLLYSNAERYLTEFRPPVSDVRISINGSLNPVVGTYKPGDWCGVIIDDPFIKLRLASDLEVRNDILVRKIENIKVTVPDGIGFPEQVELLLVPEWKVDSIGL